MIDLNTLLSFTAALIGLSLAVFVLYRDWRSFVHRAFAIGITVLAAESVLTGISANAILPEDVAYWLRLRFLAMAILPGIWLMFSLSFSRENYREFLSKWKWVVAIFFILPLSAVIFFGRNFFTGLPQVSSEYLWLAGLEWPGYVFDVFIILGVIIILMNLERTLRTSTGHMRWQIKFMIFGLGAIFGSLIYTLSQEILFRSLNISLYVINDSALILGCILIVRSLFRLKKLNINFYLSQTFLYNSLTVLFVGIYFIAVAFLARIALYFETSEQITIRALLILLALVGLLMLFLSDRLRKRLKKIVSRHFRRPLYDYRREWTRFTENTSSVTEISDLCTVVARMISNTFDILSVSIWQLDESKEHVTLGGSTVISKDRHQELSLIEENVLKLTRIIDRERLPIDFNFSHAPLSIKFKGFDEDFFDKTRIRYCVPLAVGEKMVGLMTLGDRVSHDPLSIEDFDLLGTIADQVAASLYNLMLSEQLRKAKEMEAFQTMSAFFVHDLKNLASKLSLTMQNLPIHFDNPDFRKDALQSISQSIEKINFMCSHLTSLSEKIEVSPVRASLNDLVSATIASFDGSLREKIVEDLKPLDYGMFDAEQIQRVLTNLIMNAHEATGENGKIEIVTEKRGEWAVVTVRDNGCGISGEFLKTSLFQPFKTTKTTGMGVGLYQSKSIVEAHNGKIEVESSEGKGSLFRMLLPLKSINNKE
jgi:putative PEP-CTERM system histidine kinase